MPITTGNTPKALAGGTVKRPAPKEQPAKPVKNAHHNDGGCAYHVGAGVAFPRHSH